MKNERIKFMERLSVLSVAVAMLVGCAGIKSTPPVAQSAPRAPQSLPQSCDMLEVCTDPPPVFTVTCSFFCGDPNPDFDNILCKSGTPYLSRGYDSCFKEKLVAYDPCDITSGWGCFPARANGLCGQLYARDRAIAGKVAAARFVLGGVTISVLAGLMASPAVSDWMVDATGFTRNAILTVIGLYNASAATASLRMNMAPSQALTIMSQHESLAKEEFANACTDSLDHL